MTNMLDTLTTFVECTQGNVGKLNWFAEQFVTVSASVWKQFWSRLHKIELFLHFAQEFSPQKVSRSHVRHGCCCCVALSRN